MGKLIKREVLEDFRWHDLRHCSASYMRQDGLSLGHIGNVTLATNLRRLQIVIRTLVRKELFRLEQPYPRSCMVNLRTNLRTIFWKLNLQSRLFLRRKSANNALYWEKICGQSEFLTISPRIFPMSMPTT